MQTITIKLKSLVQKRESTTLLKIIKRLYFKINHYFDIQHGTSDVFWFYGFIVFASMIGTLSIVFYLLSKALV